MNSTPMAEVEGTRVPAGRAAEVIHNGPVIHSSIGRCWHRAMRDRNPAVMPELRGPFRGSEAIRAGLVTRDVLRGSRFEKLGTDVFAPAGLPANLANRSRGVALKLNGDAVLSGYSSIERRSRLLLP